jgi:hypothetical protein
MQSGTHWHRRSKEEQLVLHPVSMWLERDFRSNIQLAFTNAWTTHMKDILQPALILQQLSWLVTRHFNTVELRNR